MPVFLSSKMTIYWYVDIFPVSLGSSVYSITFLIITMARIRTGPYHFLYRPRPLACDNLLSTVFHRLRSRLRYLEQFAAEIVTNLDALKHGSSRPFAFTSAPCWRSVWRIALGPTFAAMCTSIFASLVCNGVLGVLSEIGRDSLRNRNLIPNSSRAF